MAIWPFQPSRANRDGERLLTAVTEASRRPALFGAGRIPDTLDGRFEALTICAALALVRLRAEPGAAALAQAFTDKLFRALDSGLREAGVGDLIVPKRMHALAGSFYGRVDAYGRALADADGAALAAALGRNVFADEAHPYAPALAAHVLATANAQSAAPAADMFIPSSWPSPP
jgi:cytochrome b pre-mRNA-processing protein 3